MSLGRYNEPVNYCYWLKTAFEILFLLGIETGCPNPAHVFWPQHLQVDTPQPHCTKHLEYYRIPI